MNIGIIRYYMNYNENDDAGKSLEYIVAFQCRCANRNCVFENVSVLFRRAFRSPSL